MSDPSLKCRKHSNYILRRCASGFICFYLLTQFQFHSNYQKANLIQNFHDEPPHEDLHCLQIQLFLSGT